MNSIEYNEAGCISLKIFNIYTTLLENILGFGARARLLALGSTTLSTHKFFVSKGFSQ